MISSHHRSHVVDKGTGSCCCSPIRLAHLGEISLRVNASCSSFFSKAICFCTIVLLCFFQYLKIATKVLRLYVNKHPSNSPISSSSSTLNVYYTEAETIFRSLFLITLPLEKES